MSHTINYEHEVKDKIFFMYKNKVTEGEIEEVRITVEKSQFANSVARIISKKILVDSLMYGKHRLTSIS